MSELPHIGARDSHGRFMPGNRYGAITTPATGKLRQALIELASPQLMSEKLLQCLESDKDRMAAITLILAYNLGKPKESIDINTGSSPLPALSAETLASLVRDLQASQAPVIDATFTAQSDNPSDNLSDGD